MIAHPDVSGGQTCRALTSHIDIVPTLLSMAGVSASRKGDFAGRDLPGKDLMPAAQQPACRRACTPHATAILFTYSGLATIDAGLVRRGGRSDRRRQEPERGDEGQRLPPRPEEAGQRPHGVRRPVQVLALLRAGRPQQPGDLDELYKVNDVELFDLQTDPAETSQSRRRPGEERAI